MIVTVQPQRRFDEKTETFQYLEHPVNIELKHSLISLHKWEQKWKVPFLGKRTKFTGAMLLDYIRCMTVNKVDAIVYTMLTDDQITKIFEYVNDPMTATVVPPSTEKGEEEDLTSETIYYYMFQHGVSKECERWHLNSLLTLLRLSSHKQREAEKNASNETKNKATNKQYIDPVKFAAMNDARLKRMHTNG